MASELSSRNRLLLYATIGALLVLAAAISSISVRDPGAVWIRVAMILLTVAAAMWLPLTALIVAVPAIWLGPNFARVQFGDETLFRTETLLELPGLVGLALAATLTRLQLGAVERENDARHSHVGLQYELDEQTGVFQERLLREAVERELVRSRRFGREFALMLAAVDDKRAKFDYREENEWLSALTATAAVLLNTRTHIDRVFRFGERGFALLLPETGAKDITGLIRRLGRAARKTDPAEGEPGGPMPLHFGVTFYPQCATSVDDLLRRAEVAVRLAEKHPARVQLDGAEAPELPAPETLRGEEDEEEVAAERLAGQWLGAEAPEEESGGVWLAPRETAGPAAAAAVFEPELDLAVSSLLGRLDDTLRLIRSLKSAA